MVMIPNSFGLAIVVSACFYSQLCHCITECVEGCLCKWKHGKQTAECADAFLTSVPAGLNSETQVLDLSGNFLHTLAGRAFHSVRLVNLQKIFLARCGLSEISDDAFYRVSNLIELDLSENDLSWVPTLKDCSLLRRLQLSHNPIQHLLNNSFSSLTQLTTLEMSNCRIHTIGPSTFSGLKHLEYLRLDGNRLSYLSGKVVQPLLTLYALDLHNNPWICDCRNSGVRRWMISMNVPFSIPPRCQQPPWVQGITWDLMDIDDFACSPKVIGVDTKSSIVEGRNATLRCKIRSVPSAKITWLWQGRIIKNLSLMSFGQQMYLIEERGKDEKESILTIINVMMKDSGRYVCVASNHAGNVTVNVTVEVNPRATVDTAISGGEIAGIIIGLFLVISLCFVMVCFLAVYRRRIPSEERKSIGIKLYKNFDSVKQNHVELSTLNNGVVEDEEAGPDRQKQGNSGYSSDGTASMPSQADHDDVNSSSTGLSQKIANPDSVLTSLVDLPCDVQLYSPLSAPEPRDSDTWRYALGEDGDDSSFCANDEDHCEKMLSSSNPDPQQTHNDRTLPKDYLGSDQNLLAPSHNSFAHYLFKPNYFHLDLTSEARDSPDEGLGDEREYETDILE
ncbi:leucine-rich repeat, immunoglobulin-like domain and transmembrane domain-containing protein 2 [Limulus polyphemus]|uniref:Leucine-rich repeat, immunoglobulin-like domain and transmembrane domain-containing protein 2 n=1 Tax=Limulus polyphemus TaxID=6850 RepID=A0ABM1C2X3_LIMPO|nr:leucine-rich repeat, immunoglobulin-like domain and transmembrane domain-containing protein 2 [Limulus polyphemus]